MCCLTPRTRARRPLTAAPRRPRPQVTALSWSPTGALLASGSADHTVRCWAPDAGGALREARCLREHAAPVDALAWSSADPHALATAASDRAVILWDTRSARAAASLAVKGSALCVAWAPDGAALGVGTRDDVLHVIDTRKAAVVGTWQCPQELNEFAFAPSGLLLAGAGTRGGVVDEGALLALSLTRGGGAGAAAPTVAAGGGGAGAAAAHGAAGAVAAPSAVAPSGAAGAAAAPGAAGAAGAPAAAAPSGVRVAEVARVRAHGAPVTTLRPAPGWARVATGAGDGLVCLWDTAELACVGALDRADGQIRAIAWSGAGTHLAVAAGDTADAVKTIDFVRADGTLVRRVAGPTAVNHVTWHPVAAALVAYALDDPSAAALAAGGPGAVRDFAIKVIAA